MGKSSSVTIATLIVSLNLGAGGLASADDLDGTIDAERKRASRTGELSIREVDKASQCFARVKSNGTVWLPTQRLFDELTRLRPFLKGSMPDGAAVRRIKSLSETIVEHCELIENQHALERARYLLATLEGGTLDEASVEAVKEMLIAADGQGALRLIEGLLLRVRSR